MEMSQESCFLNSTQHLKVGDIIWSLTRVLGPQKVAFSKGHPLISGKSWWNNIPFGQILVSSTDVCTPFMSVQWESPWALGVTDGGMAPTSWFYLNDQPTISALRTHIPQGVLYASLIGVRFVRSYWSLRVKTSPEQAKKQQDVAAREYHHYWQIQLGGTVWNSATGKETHEFCLKLQPFFSNMWRYSLCDFRGQRSAIVLDVSLAISSVANDAHLSQWFQRKVSKISMSNVDWVTKSIWLIFGTHGLGTCWIWSINQSFHPNSSTQMVDFFVNPGCLTWIWEISIQRHL